MDITEYEQLRNQRKKALHDAVERTLVAAGFAEAALLRPVFSGEASSTFCGDKFRVAKTVHARKQAIVPDEVVLRRTTRSLHQLQQNALSIAGNSSALVESKEQYCTWPGKAVNNKVKKAMKKRKGDSVRSKARTKDHEMETKEKEVRVQSLDDKEREEQLVVASQEEGPSIFEEEVLEPHLPLCMPIAKGPVRPLEAGYRSTERERRHVQEWSDDFPPPYGHSSGVPSVGSFRRPWSPPPYTGGREHQGRASDYGIRGGPFEGRQQLNDRRDPYYDGGWRDIDRRGREFEDRRRYEEGRYTMRAQLPPDLYAMKVEGNVPSQYGRTSRQGTSPPPSSSAITESDLRLESTGKRPLHVDKSGFPIGKMASLFHSDIVSFVKDMDPTVGWDGQTKEAKNRLHERLMHDYEIYGDSYKLNEKYLKKAAGAALITFWYNVNQFIDKGFPKPTDLSEDYWDALKAIRESLENKAKSAKMATIARGHGSKNTTKKSLEQSVLVKLALHLKREPYPSELHEAVEKEWAIMQAEAAERRRQRSVATTSNAATKAAVDFQKRLEVLEEFALKWEVKLDDLRRTNALLKAAHFQHSSSEKENPQSQIPVYATTDDKDGTMEAEDGKTFESSPDDECTNKSRSSSDEDSESEESEEDTSASDNEEPSPLREHPTNVIEPEEESPIMNGSQKETAVLGSQHVCKTKVMTVVGAKSVAVPFNSSADIGRHHLKETLPETKEGKAKGKQSVATLMKGTHLVGGVLEANEKQKDCATKGDKDEDPEFRAGKRQKVELNLAKEPILVVEEETIGTAGKMEHVLKRKKNVRKKTNSSEGRGDMKGLKENTYALPHFESVDILWTRKYAK